MKIPRALAYPLAMGTHVAFQGRVKECADLIEPGDRLLDIGCSSGWLSAHVLAKGFRAYVGMDRVIVRGAQAASGSRFVEGSAVYLPFGDESFDAACLFDVIE